MKTLLKNLIMLTALSFAAPIGAQAAEEPVDASAKGKPTQGAVSISVQTPVGSSSTDGGYKPTAKQLAEWNKPIKGFHPIKRITRPIWKLRQEADDLQKDIVALQKPMNALEPAFQSLEGKMLGVEKGMNGLLNQLTGMNSSMTQLSLDLPKIHHISEDLSQVHRDLQDVISLHQDIREVSKVRIDIRDMSQKIRELEQPLKALHQPLVSVLTPLKNVESNVNSVNDRMVSVQSQVGEMQGQLATLSQQMADLKGPVNTVSQAPLADLKTELSELNNLLKMMLFLSVVLASATFLSCVVGFVLIYRLRNNLAPRVLGQLSSQFRKHTTDMNLNNTSELSATVAKNSDF